MGKSTRLDEHINYRLRDPFVGEAQIEYALNCAAHLVSPPKVEEESDENECIEVAGQILELIPVLTLRWEKFLKAHPQSPD